MQQFGPLLFLVTVLAVTPFLIVIVRSFARRRTPGYALQGYTLLFYAPVIAGTAAYLLPGLQNDKIAAFAGIYLTISLTVTGYVAAADTYRYMKLEKSERSLYWKRVNKIVTASLGRGKPEDIPIILSPNPMSGARAVTLYNSVVTRMNTQDYTAVQWEAILSDSLFPEYHEMEMIHHWAKTPALALAVMSLNVERETYGWVPGLAAKSLTEKISKITNPNEITAIVDYVTREPFPVNLIVNGPVEALASHPLVNAAEAKKIAENILELPEGALEDGKRDGEFRNNYLTVLQMLASREDIPTDIRSIMLVRIATS